MSLVLNGSGTITGLNAGGLPSASVTQASLATGVAGTGPAFSAYQSSGQSVSHNTNTKVQFQTENYDTNNNFDSTTNYRFTPTIAGYYNITASVQINSLTANSFCMLYKNGSWIAQSPTGVGWAGISNTISMLVCNVSMNGTTDYLEVYVYQATGSSVNTLTGGTTTFSGFLTRAA